MGIKAVPPRDTFQVKKETERDGERETETERKSVCECQVSQIAKKCGRNFNLCRFRELNFFILFENDNFAFKSTGLDSTKYYHQII